MAYPVQTILPNGASLRPIAPRRRSPAKRRSRGRTHAPLPPPRPATNDAATLSLAGTAQADVLSADDPAVNTTDTAALNTALDLTPLTVVEDCEDAVLIPGLTSSLAVDGRNLPRHAGDGTTTTVSGNAPFTLSLSGVHRIGIGISDNHGDGALAHLRRKRAA